MDGRTAAGVVALVRELDRPDACLDCLPPNERDIWDEHGRPVAAALESGPGLAALEAHGPALAAWYAARGVVVMSAGAEVWAAFGLGDHD